MMIDNIKYQKDEIKNRRNRVYEDFIQRSSNIKSGTITKISAYDLRILFCIYDDIFFNSYFKDNFKGKLEFSLSTRMTSSAGKTIFLKNIKSKRDEDITIEIRMGMNFFFEYYKTNKEKEVNGIIPKDSLEAFLLVFEHELCHFLELVAFRETSCRAKRFKAIAYNIFGHTDVYHKLPGSREIAREKYGITVGSIVTFNYEDKLLKGVVNNINKRATVMVVDIKGNYVDNRGNRYSKYYVPLQNLKNI